MNGLPYYKRYPRDFIEGSLGLPFELKGAYSIILDLIYLQGGKLPDDSRYISGILGVSVRKWNSLRLGLIEAGKIQVNGELLTNYRAVSELETLRKYQDKQRENRSRPNKNNDLAVTVVSPKGHHTEPEPDIVKEDTNVSSKKKRGTRLPDDWFLPAEWGRWALSEGWPETTIRAESEKFKDYWHSVSGQKGVKLNWLAVWRNWLRNSNQPKVINGGQHGHTTNNTNRVQRIITAAAEGSSRQDWG